MKIPKKINILGHKYEILLQNRDETGGTANLGTAYIYQNKIFIHTKQAQSQRESSLIHEIIECINGILGLDLKENQIRGLETGIYQTLKDNQLLNDNGKQNKI